MVDGVEPAVVGMQGGKEGVALAVDLFQVKLGKGNPGDWAGQIGEQNLVIDHFVGTRLFSRPSGAIGKDRHLVARWCGTRRF